MIHGVNMRHATSHWRVSWGYRLHTRNAMPQLIEYIDAIARKKLRDVLFIRFSDPLDHGDDLDKPSNTSDWKSSTVRQAVINWLDKCQIGWRPCGDVACTNYMTSYAGQIYVDVPFDEADPVFQQLVSHLENPDGSMRLAGVWFCALTLHAAMKNAHHDEPGFWERWAETF